MHFLEEASVSNWYVKKRSMVSFLDTIFKLYDDLLIKAIIVLEIYKEVLLL